MSLVTASRLLVMAILVAFSFCESSMAQVAPVRLNVTKKQAFNAQRLTVDWVERDTGRRVGTAYSSVSYSGSSVHCQIEVFNNGLRLLPSLSVRWALLMTP